MNNSNYAAKEILTLLLKKGWVSTECFSSEHVERDIKNIIDNALKFSSNKIEIFLSSNENELRIKVEDDGEGFSKQILGFLGDPYINKRDLDNNKEGLGLGIFIAKVFLERLSAVINFYNLENKGAAVDISWQKKDLINLKLI